MIVSGINVSQLLGIKKANYNNKTNANPTFSGQMPNDTYEFSANRANTTQACNGASGCNKTNSLSELSDMTTNFELNLSTEELQKRTHKDHLISRPMLDIGAYEYNNLEEGDKKALKYLTRAAMMMDEVYMQQDNALNLEFRKYLENETANGNKDAEMALTLFNAQLGMIGIDFESQKVELAKGYKDTLGRGFYPADLGKEEFHQILISMLQSGNDDDIQEVRNILNQRSMVVRDGDKLEAIDFTEYFEDEFSYIAEQLERAAQVSTNSDFNEYLRLQVNALLANDPMLDAFADKKWAQLQDTPLEFTISRESYEDELTGSVVENAELMELLDKYNITPLTKDSLGVRVGIVNKEGTEKLLEIKQYLPLLAANMPFADEYEQNISAEDDKQTMVDVDIVTMRGEEGAYRGGVTLAQNLPNNDKKSIEIGGGRRNVYHRQIRTNNSPDAIERRQKRLNATLAPELHRYYDLESDHWFTIGHENAHSLGPKNVTGLGAYTHIIEENKADMGSLAMIDILCEQGMYTAEERKKILVTFATDAFSKACPPLNKAHAVRAVMQTKYFMERGAFWLNEQGLIEVDCDKMVETAKEMLEEIIRIQLSGDFNLAEKYVKENFVWTDDMEKMAGILKEHDKALNGVLKSPLADAIVAED